MWLESYEHCGSHIALSVCALQWAKTQQDQQGAQKDEKNRGSGIPPGFVEYCFLPC